MKALSLTFSFNVFFIFIFILSSVARAESEIPFDVEENLISFSPAIKLESGEECQGFRVAKVLIASSPQCIMILSNKLIAGHVSVLDINANPIGTIVESSETRIDEVSEPDLLISMRNIRENETYFDTPLYTSNNLPEKNTVFYLNEQAAIIHESVSLSRLVLPDKEGYLGLKSATKTPAGAPVFDAKGNLVCLVSGSNECRVLSPGLTYNSRTLKSSEDDYAVAAATPYIIIGGIVAVTTAVATSSFYIILLVRARLKGMPAGVACQGLCSCGYCSGWTALSTVFCVAGGVLCPLTNGVCSVPFWWSAAFTAAWNWVNSYSGVSGTEPLLPTADNPPEYFPQPEVVVE